MTMSTSPDYKTQLENVNKELETVKDELNKQNYHSKEMLHTLRRRKKKLLKQQHDLEILSK